MGAGLRPLSERTTPLRPPCLGRSKRGRTFRTITFQISAKDTKFSYMELTWRPCLNKPHPVGQNAYSSSLVPTLTQRTRGGDSLSD